MSLSVLSSISFLFLASYTALRSWSSSRRGKGFTATVVAMSFLKLGRWVKGSSLPREVSATKHFHSATSPRSITFIGSRASPIIGEEKLHRSTVKIIGVGVFTLPRIWLYLREHIYTELERIARERGIGIDDVVKQLIEDFVKGKLVPQSEASTACDGLKQEVQELRRRIELLEEMLRFVLNTLRGAK